MVLSEKLDLKFANKHVLDHPVIQQRLAFSKLFKNKTVSNKNTNKN